MNGDYNSCRGTNGKIVRANQTFRIDKNRNEIAIFINDQLIGHKSISNLSSFGSSHFEFDFSSSTIDSMDCYIKQIGLKLEC